MPLLSDSDSSSTSPLTTSLGLSNASAAVVRNGKSDSATGSPTSRMVDLKASFSPKLFSFVVFAPTVPKLEGTLSGSLSALPSAPRAAGTGAGTVEKLVVDGDSFVAIGFESGMSVA